MKVVREVPNEEARNFSNLVDELFGSEFADRMKEVQGDFWTRFTVLARNQKESDEFESLNL